MLLRYRWRKFCKFYSWVSVMPNLMWKFSDLNGLKDACQFLDTRLNGNQICRKVFSEAVATGKVANVYYFTSSLLCFL